MMALQEHSLYDEPPRRHYEKADNNSSMYLDLKTNKTHLLHTPDVSVFALSTPEVHNLLSTAGNTTSVTSVIPSPAGLLRNNHPVTMEQEYYAKGFLDRLEALQAGEIHNKNLTDPSLSLGVHYSTSNYASGPNPSLEAVAPTYVTATLDHIPNFATATQTNSETTASYPVSSRHDAYYTEAYTMPFRHEAAMMSGYPMLTTGGVAMTQPMYSIMDTHVSSDALKEMTIVPDMQTQEHMKVERKKARNRIAASKCRNKRLQREADLESKVKVLKDHNKELNDEVNGLREQITNLKKALLQHMRTGCQVDVPSDINLSPEHPTSSRR